MSGAQETVLTLARELSGAGEAEEALLELLCQAAEQQWEKRLRPGMTAEDCGKAFPCAVAFTAAADLAAAACLLLSSLFGIPVSTTHTKTSAIMGVGAVKRLSAINFGVVKDMMLTWVFTFPGCGLISFVMAKIFTAIF